MILAGSFVSRTSGGTSTSDSSAAMVDSCSGLLALALPPLPAAPSAPPTAVRSCGAGAVPAEPMSFVMAISARNVDRRLYCEE